jgi:hypothetical protein
MAKKNTGVATKSVSATSIVFAARAKRTSVYDGVIADIAKMKPGRAIVAVRPKHVPVPVFQARLNASVRRSISMGRLKLPKGATLIKRDTEDGNVGIIMPKGKQRKLKQAPAEASTAA